MQILYVRFETDADPEAFDAWILPIVHATREQPGTVAYDYFHDPEVPTRRWLVEVFADEDARRFHVTTPRHVEMMAVGSRRHGMRDIHVHEWTDAAGHRTSFLAGTDAPAPGREEFLSLVTARQRELDIAPEPPATATEEPTQ